MSEVRLDIRAVDNASNVLENLRNKARELSVDISDINEEQFQQLTKTQQLKYVEDKVKGIYSQKRQQVVDDYQEIWKDRASVYAEHKKEYQTANYSRRRELDEWFRRYRQENIILKNIQDREIKDIEKEEKEYLREILKELRLQHKIQEEQHREKLREEKEARESGLLGRLQVENRELNKRLAAATDEDEIQAIVEKLEENRKQMRQIRKGEVDIDDSEDESKRTGRDKTHAYGRIISGVGSGNLNEVLSGSMSLLGKMAIAGAIVYALKSFFGLGDELREKVAVSAGARGGFQNVSDYNLYLREQLTSESSRVADLGLKGDEFAMKMNEYVVQSRITDNIVERTLQRLAVEKAYGVNLGGFSKMERWEINQEKSVDISLRMLNVLSAIKESSLKTTDLATFTEKLQAQQSILEIQRQRRDLVDSEAGLRILAAFEKVGLSGKGERAADFIQQTFMGIGEGGNENEMLLKFEAARRAFPQFANNPAMLRRMLKFHSDDPRYIKAIMELLGEISGGEQLAMDDIIYSFFNPKSELDMKMYERLMKGDKEAYDLLTGKKPLPSSEEFKMDKVWGDMKANVSYISDAMNTFRNFIQRISVSAEGAVHVKQVNSSVMENKIKSGK